MKQPFTYFSRIFKYIYLSVFLGLPIFSFAQPDLVVVQSTLVNSFYVANLNNPDQCMVNEGCIGGLGERQLIRFSTHIKNIGNQDFYVGAPPNNPADENESWEWDECHNHWHYEGYAEYIVLDEFGNQTPIGVKNGFCLIDIECSGGGTFTYSCSNQGISAGCGDIYGSGLDCQWVDITDLPDGQYTLIVRANWDGSPDANNVYETSYENNAVEVCFNLSRDSTGTASVDLQGNGCDLNEECIDLTVSITMDEYPIESSWSITDPAGAVVASGNNYSEAFATITTNVCLPVGCYDFKINDSQGDGLCCAFGQGSYQVSDASGNILAAGAEFTYSESTNICVVDPNSNCIDEDNDGLCVEVDCNDNDNTLPAPPGVSCDDNDPNTINDIIQEDGCSCAGTPCIDADSDGHCAEDDCDDNNANLPATVGSSCDDGNVNTENDLIQADGCTCMGTPIVPTTDCNIVSIVGGENVITVSNLEAFVHVNIQVFTDTWGGVHQCVDNCNNPFELSDLPAGGYLVSVKLFDVNWQTVCDIFVDVEVTGDAGPCTDNDNDGICANDDCNDNDPNLPAAAGTACDDGNPLTENDVIQSDGCTCAGDLVATGDCANIAITTADGAILINGTGSFPFVNIQIFNASWQRVDNCTGVCPSPYEASNLDEGVYHVSVKTFNGNWQTECDILIDVVVSGQSGPCTDADGDGICVNQDCDDNDPNLPTTVGSSCDDGSTDTENDVIQADGCTCAGTPIVTGNGCDDVILSGGPGVIGIINAGLYPHSSILIMNDRWERMDLCIDDCMEPYELNNLAPGDYFVQVKLYNESWQEICYFNETITVGQVALSVLSEQLNEPLPLHVSRQLDNARLEWIVINEYKTSNFEIEKSWDGIIFKSMSTIDITSISHEAKQFSQLDKLRTEGKKFYRIKQTFIDGSFRYSEVKNIDFLISGDFNVYPNPTRKNITLDLTQLTEKEMTVMVYDALGHPVYSSAKRAYQEGVLEINLDQFEPGVYMVILHIEGRKDLGKRVVVLR